MATVFLGYRRTAYDRLSASWKDNYWSVYRRTNIQVTRCDQAKSDESCHLGADCFITMHQRTSHWLQAVCNCEFVQLNHPAYSPDLAPSDYFLIRNLKYRLRGTWFIDNESLKIAVKA